MADVMLRAACADLPEEVRGAADGHEVERPRNADGAALCYLLDAMQPAREESCAMLLLSLCDAVEEDELAMADVGRSEPPSPADPRTCDETELISQLAQLRGLTGDRGWTEWRQKLPGAAATTTRSGPGTHTRRDVTGLLLYLLEPANDARPAARPHFSRHTYAILSQRVGAAISSAQQLVVGA